MNAKSKKRKKWVRPKKIYTFNIKCSFNLQFSFTDLEVEPDPEGGEGDFNPTEKALRGLEKELTEVLHQNYGVENLEAYADSDNLIGILDE